jgi:POT family proton-dependent oligopeptide transporter
VGEIRRKLKACRVLGFFVIFWLCYNQTTNNNISQAGQEFQKGISNDTIQAFNLGIAAPRYSDYWVMNGLRGD